MAIVCEKCGKEFALIDEGGGENVFCPYCGAQTGAEEVGELVLGAPEEETVVQPVVEQPAAEEQPTDGEKKLLMATSASFADFIVTFVGMIVMAVLGFASICGVIALVGWIFQINITWAFWQWVIGIGGGLAFAFIVAMGSFLAHENSIGDYAVTGLWIFGASVLVNFVLAAIFRAEYLVVFGAFSVVHALMGFGFAIASRETWEETGVTVGFVLEALAAIGLMVLGLSIFSTPAIAGETPTGWEFWRWVVGIGGAIVVAVIASAICYYLDENWLCDYPVSGLIAVATVAIVNFLLLTIIGLNYKVIFGCFGVASALAAMILACICHEEMEDDGYVAGFWIEFGIALLALPIGLIFF